MADVPSTLASLNGITKVVYAKKFQDKIPPAHKLLERLKWLDGGKLGKYYEVMVELALSQGMTYAAPNSGAFDINDMVPGFSDTAQVNSNQFLFVDGIDYETVEKAKEKGDKAMDNAVTRVLARAQKSMTKRVELSFWYGGTSLGVVGALAATSGTADSQGYFSRVVTISTATWGSGIWMGMKGAKVEFRVLDTSGYATSTVRGTPGGAAQMLLGAPNVNLRQLTIRSTSATDLNAITVGDGIVFSGTYLKETMGLDRIATNTGVLWGIDAAQWPDTWAGNTYDLGGRELTLRRFYEALGGTIAKGLEDTTVQAYVNPATFANLLANEASLVRHGEATGQKAKNGFKSLEFQGQHGGIEIIPYTVVKEGEAFVGPVDTLSKVGAKDIGLQPTPGGGEGDYWKHMEKKAGAEVRWYANMGLFTDSISQWTKLSGIVNQA